MALFRNLSVNPRDRLCDVPWYASAQSLDFLDLANPDTSGLNWKLAPVPTYFLVVRGWALPNISMGFFKSFQKQAGGRHADHVQGFMDHVGQKDDALALERLRQGTKPVVHGMNGMIFVTKSWDEWCRAFGAANGGANLNITKIDFRSMDKGLKPS
jgi:hypothetical protein